MRARRGEVKNRSVFNLPCTTKTLIIIPAILFDGVDKISFASNFICSNHKNMLKLSLTKVSTLFFGLRMMLMQIYSKFMISFCLCDFNVKFGGRSEKNK